MSENNNFQQIQKLSQEQIQIQRANQNQVILGQLIEMNDEEIKDRIEMELDDNPALELADAAEQDDFDSDNVNDNGNEVTAEVGKDNEDPFVGMYLVDLIDLLDDYKNGNI